MHFNFELVSFQGGPLLNVFYKVHNYMLLVITSIFSYSYSALLLYTTSYSSTLSVSFHYVV